jgi:hypothetical protein
MAPGLGPWRPDMAPYVDEHGPDLVKLGLEWHSKMLLRIEIAGTIINSYLLRSLCTLLVLLPDTLTVVLCQPHGSSDTN